MSFKQKAKTDLKCDLCGQIIKTGDYYYHDYLFPDIPECVNCIEGANNMNTKIMAEFSVREISNEKHTESKTQLVINEKEVIAETYFKPFYAPGERGLYEKLFDTVKHYIINPPPAPAPGDKQRLINNIIEKEIYLGKIKYSNGVDISIRAGDLMKRPLKDIEKISREMYASYFKANQYIEKWILKGMGKPVPDYLNDVTIPAPGPRQYLPHGLTETEKHFPAVRGKISRCIKKLEKDHDVSSAVAICRHSIES